MIKIVHIISGLRTGGAETTLLRVVARMDRTRFRNVVVSLTGRGALGDSIEQKGVPVHAVNIRSSAPNPLAILRLQRLLRSESPDIVQTWLYDADLIGLLATKLAGLPILAMNIRCSSLDVRSTRRSIILKLLAKFSTVPAAIVVNSRVGQRVHEDLGYRPRQWELIPNGFDIDEFRPDPAARSAFRETLRIAPDEILIGAAGRYEAMKDYPTFLRSAAQVVRNNPRAHFAIAGAEVTAQNRELQPLIESLGIGAHVHLLGQRRDLPQVMPAFDIFCSSSAYGEGMQNTVGEAMASGVPCVVTDVGDAGELVGDTGIVVQPRNPDALASAIEQLLGSPDHMAELGRSARERIATHYSIRAAVEHYERFYTALAHGEARYHPPRADD
jgi:glycosyltransferase involved in cell wall biosynthesis